MTNLEAIEKIRSSKASESLKEGLLRVASEFDFFLELSKKYAREGLLAACRRNLGVSFFGMYGIKKVDDLVRMAEHNSILA